MYILYLYEKCCLQKSKLPSTENYKSNKYRTLSYLQYLCLKLSSKRQSGDENLL